jgi:hypothetical protein
MRCSVLSRLRPGPTWPLTVTVVPFWTASAVTKPSCTTVSPAGVSPKRMDTTSPGWMSGVMFRLVPAPQQ